MIERFLPAQMSDDEAQAAIRAIIAETGASSMKDMGRVMALVKERLGTSIEPARASGLVKAALALRRPAAASGGASKLSKLGRRSSCRCDVAQPACTHSSASDQAIISMPRCTTAGRRCRAADCRTSLSCAPMAGLWPSVDAEIGRAMTVAARRRPSTGA